MRKFVAAVLALVLCLSLCACGNDGIPQSEYDSLFAEYDDLKSAYDELETANVSLSGELRDVQSKLEAAEKQIEELQAALSGATSPQMRSPDGSVLVYDDDYVTISFLGCEDGTRQYLVFYVINKTEYELNFQSGSMAINGESLGYISGSDAVAAQSRGKIRFSTQEAFPTLNPSYISGVIKVIDFSKTAWGKQSFDVSFINLEIASSASVPDDVPADDAPVASASSSGVSSGLSIDLCDAVAYASLASDFGSNFSFSSGNGIVEITICDIDVTTAAYNAMHDSWDRDKFLERWDAVVGVYQDWCGSFQTMYSENGHDVVVKLNIENDRNNNELILSVTPDSVLYDIVEENSDSD